MQGLELQHGTWRLVLRPDLGGCIAGLWLGDVPVLRSTPAPELATVRLAGSYPLVPFSNRIGQAELIWNGTSHPLVKNFAGEEHAIHGLGWQRPWEVLESDDSFAMLSLEHKADADWPFAFDCSQTFRLGDEGLEMTLSMTNQSQVPAPAGLGWHPFLVKRPDSHLRFAATGRWEMGTDRLPTVRKTSRGLDVDCANLDSDHCFDGWTGDVEMQDAVLHTRMVSGLQRLVVFTNSTKDFVAVEPVSHVNNAINLVAQSQDPKRTFEQFAEELGVKTLQPGESWSVQMAIYAELRSEHMQ